jgi:predicted nuclease of restriction endonuclease-like (RecB) superfamily
MVAQISPEALKIFRDGYNVEFLALLSVHAEVDLHRGLPGKLKDCLIELGRDFCFADSEYPLQVGDRDFALNRLFFHQCLNALVVWSYVDALTTVKSKEPRLQRSLSEHRSNLVFA